MSMINKIKEITNNMESLAKEKPTVHIVSNTKILIENYRSIKIFDINSLILETDEIYICIKGQNLTVEYFSPSRIIACGKIDEIAYKPSLVSEEL